MTEPRWDRTTVGQIITSLRLAGEPEAADHVAALLADAVAVPELRIRLASAEAARESLLGDIHAIRDIVWSDRWLNRYDPALMALRDVFRHGPAAGRAEGEVTGDGAA